MNNSAQSSLHSLQLGKSPAPDGMARNSYAEVRDTCKETGLFDGNFNKVLKKNSDLFKGAITADKINEDEQIELTGGGQTRLAEVIEKLAGE